MQFHIKHNHANPAQLVPQLASHCPGVFLSKLETLSPFADKAPLFQGVLGMIVSTVTVGRCQKSGYICCTAQPGSCIWWLLALQDATYTPNKLLWFCANRNFSISTFEPFMSFVKVTQNSHSTHIIPPEKITMHFTIIFKGLHFSL